MTSWPAALLAVLAVPAPGGDPPLTGGARWGAEYFPNVPLVTHEGETVRFFDDLIRDKVVAINFIYTSCPDACPLETAKLAEVQSLLGERVGKDVFLYSISIDPERDTPEVLRAYGERFRAGPGWLFLTGAAADIRLVRQKLGMIASGEERLQDHTLSLMIGNQATGKWMKRSPMENPYLLATQLGSWLHDWRPPPEPGKDYAEAPALRSVTRGESLFRTRCLTCHAIGAEDGIPRQGPNLLGVTALRERAWLRRWLAEPDVMLAEGDPLALELRAAYRDLPMPNMRLAEVEVDAILAYIEEESAWYARANAEWEDPVPEAEELPWDGPGDAVGAAGAADTGRPACCAKEDLLVFDDVVSGEAAPAPRVDTGSLAAPVVIPMPAAPSGAEPTARPVQAGAGHSRPLCLGAGLALVLGLFGLLSAAPGSRAPRRASP